MKDKLPLLISIATVVAFACLAGLPLLKKGLPPTHDGEYHVIRFYEFDKVLRSGVLYPRWAPDLNYGYGVPLFNYVYPLPNYVASLLHLFGISFIDGLKLQMFFATILGGIFFYLWIKGFWGNLGGIVSSVFYIFSPYRFVDIYIRGSVGEVWALAFFPAFLWAITRYMQDKQKIFFILSSIFLSLIIFSHNILALMFFIFSIFYIVFFIYQDKNKKYSILNTFYIILLGLGISAIFWLPAIYESKYVTGLQIFDVTVHFPELYQLLIPTWGSGFSGAGLQNELSFQIGVANLIGVFLSLIAMIIQIIRKQKVFFYTIFFLVWFIFTLFLMIDISKPVWKMVPLMNYFQFPWRLLSLEILFASFLAGSIFSLRLNWIKLPIFLFLFFLSFGLGIGYTKPVYYHNRNDNYYITRSNFIDGTNSPGDVFNTIWFNQNLKKQNTRIILDKGKLESSIIKPTVHRYFVSVVSESNAIVNIAYFPNWTVFIDQKKITTRQDSNGLISFIVPSGKHLIEIKFGDTPIRTIANFVSLATLFFIVFYSMRWYNIVSLFKNYGKN